MIANTQRAFGQFRPRSRATPSVTAHAQSRSCGTITVSGDLPGTGDSGVDPGQEPGGGGFAMSPAMLGGAALVGLLLLVR